MVRTRISAASVRQLHITDNFTLAPRYTSTALGDVKVQRLKTATVFDFGEWKSTVASRKNDGGTISFITIDPTTRGFEFVVGERGGKRVPIIRGGQHEYVFDEAA